MPDSPRSPTGAKNGDAPEHTSPSAPAPAASERPAAGATPSKPPDARFVGNAMKALFESSDVTIKRGDETRVMSRAQEVIAEIQRKTSAPPPPGTSAEALDRSLSSHPPGPRVDAVLWIVLAVGLFAIAGWMMAYAL